jgi:hypothetical protein
MHLCELVGKEMLGNHDVTELVKTPQPLFDLKMNVDVYNYHI